ncbi:MAG: MMPL family transporter [Polyangiales bacterium]
MLARYVSLVVDHPRRPLLIVFLCVAALAVPASGVRLDNDFSKLYSTATEADAYRLFFREEFGANDGLLVAVMNPATPEDPAFTALLDRITDESARDIAVAHVFSATHTSVPFSQGDTVVFGPLFGSDSEFQGDLQARVERMTESPLGQRLVSRDGLLYVVGAELERERTSYESVVAPAERFMERVEREVASSNLDVRVHFAGIPRTRIHATESLELDLFYLSPLVVLVLSILLWLLVRSFWAVAVSLFALLLSVVGTAGVIGLFDDDLNFLTVLYPIFLTAVVVAHSVHLIHQYKRELGRPDASLDDALRRASARVVKAALLTSTTTAIGFGSLVAARATILRTFGLYLSIGVVLSFIVVTLVLPPGLALLGPRVFGERQGLVRREAPRWFRAALRTVTTTRGAWITTAAGSALLLGAFAYGSGVHFDYVLSDHTKGEPTLVRGNAIMDEHLGGIVPIEISLLGREGDFKSPENLARMQVAADWLENAYGIPAPIGLSGVLRELNREFGGVDAVPESDALVAQLLLVAESSPDRVVPQLVSDDFSHARLRTSASDRGANYIVSMWHAFDDYAKELFAGTGISARMTGGMVIGYDGMKQLSTELVRSVMIALLLVVVFIGIAFRSVRLGLAAILPNLLPVAIGLATLHATGNVVNPVPGIVFCIGIGLSVDDTIHLFAHYREELSQGAGVCEAVRRAVNETFGALVTTTVVLTVGLGLLLLSRSDLNQTIGWLSGTVFVTALLSDLLITPAILVTLRPHFGPNRVPLPICSPEL